MKFDDDYQIDVVDFARQIIRLNDRAMQLEEVIADRDYWRNEAMNLTQSSIQHSRELMGTVLTSLLDPESLLGKKSHSEVTEQP
jgi:hypothetical protein